MKAPKHKHYCWYCGGILDHQNRIALDAFNSHFPKPPYYYWLTCLNHGSCYVVFIVIEQVDKHLELKQVQIKNKNNKEESGSFYYNGQFFYFHTLETSGIKLSSEIFTNGTDPEKIYQRAKMMIMLS